MPDSQLTKEEIQQIHRLLECVKEERFYELLDVHPHAASDTIRNAYYGLSRNWHPDRFFRRDLGDQKSSIEVIFMGITKAYRTLSDDQKRVEYDRTHVITRNDTSQVSVDGGSARAVSLNRDYSIDLELHMAPRSIHTVVISSNEFYASQ